MSSRCDSQRASAAALRPETWPSARPLPIFPVPWRDSFSITRTMRMPIASVADWDHEHCGVADRAFFPFDRSGEEPLQDRPVAVGKHDPPPQRTFALSIAALGRKPPDPARGDRREEAFDSLEIKIARHSRRIDQDTPLAGFGSLSAGILARTVLEPEAPAGQRTRENLDHECDRRALVAA